MGKKWLYRRNSLGSNTNILQELQSYELDFENYMRMSVSTFYTLLAKVEPYIKKQDTHMRHSNAEIFSNWEHVFVTAVQYTDLQTKLVPHNPRNLPGHIRGAKG